MRPQNPATVKEVINRVRSRIKTGRVLRGVAITLGLTAVALIGAALLAARYQQRPGLLLLLRLVPVVIALASAAWFVLRPLRERLSDNQIARLLEEKFKLDDRVTTIVEYSEEPRGASPVILQHLATDADTRVATTDVNEAVDMRRAYAYGAGAGLAWAAIIVALFLFPSVRTGVTALYDPSGEGVQADAMFIEVTPTSGRVPRGSDQKIKAKLNGFDAAVSQVFIRKLSDASWLATPMELAKNQGEFQHVLFNIQDSIVFYVESNGVRSPEQTLEVVDLPYVKQLDLVLMPPSYTGQAAKKIENGGEIAALKGTVVRITAILSAKAKSARIIFNDGSKVEMSPDVEATTDNEFHFFGQFTVTKAGTYKIELTSEDGEKYNGSNEFDITLLEDLGPTVVIDKPGRDMKVTNIQEVFSQAKAEDDFGVASIEFFYSVNGGEEKSVSLQDLKRDEPKTLSGSYTFFLEEMGLQVGDFVSYYAKAKDNTGQESTSDIYFLEVRPFDREFRQSQQQGGQPGGQQQQEQDSNALARKQREIIAATFRIQREEKQYVPEERDENFGTVALSQEKLKGDTDQLVDRIKRRMGERLTTDQNFSKLVEFLTQAAKEMDVAKDKLREKVTKEALPPEQRALQQLLKAEAVFREIQVGQQQSQGGGGQQQQQNRDLADLMELQLDKMKNQYETVQRQQQQQQSQEQDDLARRLEELAKRQQKELEQRMRQQAQQQQGGGGGGNQRQQQEMLEEAERLKRELERLSRDRRDPQMQQAQQQVQQAIEEMKRAQSLSSNSQSPQAQQEANARTQRAQQRLEQARRLLNSSRQASGQQNVQQLRQRAEEAKRKQQDIQRSIDEMAKGGQAAGDEQKQQVQERKQNLADQMEGLQQDIDQTARGMGQDKQQAADKLREAANSIRSNRIPDRIRQNNQMINGGYYEQAKQREQIINDNIDEVLKKLQAAEKDSNRRQGEGMEDALNRARELADNLESLRRRAEGQNGTQQDQQNGQQGQQGQEQSRNQQGQQQGQQGQQQGQQAGRNQQGQQQGQQGQRPGQQQGQRPGQQQGQQANQQRNQQGQQQTGQQGQQAGQQGRQQGQQQGQEGQRGQQGQQGQRGQQGQQGQEGQQGGRQQGGQQGGQQAQGQQGGRQQGGQQGGQPQQGGQQEGNRAQQSDNRGGGGRPGSQRQLGSELRERLAEAQDLRRSLQDKDLIRDLDAIIDEMRRINPEAFSDPSQMLQLKSEVIDPLRQLEFEIARRLQAKLGNKGLGSVNDGDAPDRYRKTIEDYYRRLSSRGSGSKP